jgi:threonyl-tRNA synthetase
MGDHANTEKYYKNDAAWEKGESLLREVLQKRAGKFIEAKDEAAFYGPKIDVQMKNVNGKEDTAFTVQYDFCMPDRFDLTYTSNDGTKKRAFVVHRSSIGAIERIMAFLIEKYAGAFPVWLSPVQVRILPVSEKQRDYANEIFDTLKNAGVRVEIDDSDTLGKRIRSGKVAKVPYILVVGDQEKDAGTVTAEHREKGKLPAQKMTDFTTSLLQEIKERR